LLFLASASSANALCVYKGDLYAKTTIEQEFQDSKFVVLGTVLSSREIPIPDNDLNAESGVIYRIRINQVFKGRAPSVIANYSERNSGGFYLDVGTQYLLFLNPMTVDDGAKQVAPGALRVNYSCGQSRPWREIAAEAKKRLATLSMGDR
jgi:hypothetical protein